jgi:L-2-hydroxyglutarate oxidase LhgO
MTLAFRSQHKEKSISNTSISKHQQRKELKMAKTKNRIKKMTFQTQERKLDYTPLTEDDKYIIEMAGYRKQGLNTDEKLQRTTGRVARPQYI